MSEWVKLTERIPEKGVEVLVWCGGVMDKYEIGYVPTEKEEKHYKENDKYYQRHNALILCWGHDYDGSPGWSYDATHWMPLPEPPK
jgi:hypothetical protein